MIENSICKLCYLEKPLKESHIIPKFIFRWLRQTGGKYLRKVDNPNKRVEDGVKEYLLCYDCEQLFSKLEDKFARDIFYPYSNNKIDRFSYDSDLIRFSISVLYRLLLTNFNEENMHKNELIEARNEWKEYLYLNGQLNKYNRIHIFFTTNELINKVLPAERFLNYYSRGTDGEIVSSTKTCIVYVKMARVILIGEIKGFDNSAMKNTLINPNGGEIFTKQMKLNYQIKEFLISRVKQLNECFDLVSDKQINIALNYSDSLINSPACSDIKKIVDAETDAIIDENLIDFE